MWSPHCRERYDQTPAPCPECHECAPNECVCKPETAELPASPPVRERAVDAVACDVNERPRRSERVTGDLAYSALDAHVREKRIEGRHDLTFQIGGAQLGGDELRQIIQEAFTETDDNMLHLRGKHRACRRAALCKDGKAVAGAIVKAHTDLKCLQVTLLAVAPEARQQGYGSILFACLLELGWKADLAVVVVPATRDAVPFWAGQGLLEKRSWSGCSLAVAQLLRRQVKRLEQQPDELQLCADSVVMAAAMSELAQDGAAVGRVLERLTHRCEDDFTPSEAAANLGYEEIVHNFWLGRDGERTPATPCLDGADEEPKRPRVPYEELRVFQTGNGRGWGCRSRVQIEGGFVIGEMVGRLLTQQEFDALDDVGVEYVTSFDDETLEKKRQADDPVRYIDSREQGNVMRFLNDSSTPNCQLIYNAKKTRAFLASRFLIPAGVELTWNYGPHYTRRWLRRATTSETKCFLRSAKLEPYDDQMADKGYECIFQIKALGEEQLEPFFERIQMTKIGHIKRFKWWLKRIIMLPRQTKDSDTLPCDALFCVTAEVGFEHYPLEEVRRHELSNVAGTYSCSQMENESKRTVQMENESKTVTPDANTRQHGGEAAQRTKLEFDSPVANVSTVADAALLCIDENCADGSLPMRRSQRRVPRRLEDMFVIGAHVRTGGFQDGRSTFFEGIIQTLADPWGRFLVAFSDGSSEWLSPSEMKPRESIDMDCDDDLKVKEAELELAKLSGRRPRSRFKRHGTMLLNCPGAKKAQSMAKKRTHKLCGLQLYVAQRSAGITEVSGDTGLCKERLLKPLGFKWVPGLKVWRWDGQGDATDDPTSKLQQLCVTYGVKCEVKCRPMFAPAHYAAEEFETIMDKTVPYKKRRMLVERQHVECATEVLDE
jgi:GNAT superfamily N-acetyltransferase